MISECNNCDGFGICDLFLRSSHNLQAKEERMKCEDYHRKERNLRSSRLSTQEKDQYEPKNS